MLQSSIAVRPARWPWIIAIVSALAGVVLFAPLAASASAATVPLFLGLTIAWASSHAAGAILIGTAIAAVARRGRPLEGSRLPLALALATGLGLFIAVVAAICAAVVTIGGAGSAVGGVLAALSIAAVLAVVIAKRRRLPTPTFRSQLMLLAVPFVIVTIAREGGQLQLSRTSSEQQYKTHRTSSWHCTASGGASSRLPDYQPDYWMSVDGLGGDIGDLLSEMTANERPATEGLMSVLWMGDLDLDSTSCYLPLYRAGDVHSQLTFSASWYDDPTAGITDRSASCSITGTLTIDLSSSMIGVATCRDLRKYVAKAALAAMHNAVQESMK